MTKCMWILQMYILLTFSNLTAAKVNFTLINGLGNLNDYAMECNSSVIIQCKAPANVPLVQWKINYTIELDTGLAARCIVSPCITYNNFSGRYIYTYDASAKVSNLTINPVIAEDSGRKYLCDDGSFPPPFDPTFIVSPSYISTKTNTTYTKDGIEISVKTGCIFPSDKITFSWYSISGDGVRENYTDSLLSVMECSEKTICFISNGSAQIESFLKIPKAIGIITELREFAVDIVYENINKFTVAVGSYNVTKNIHAKKEVVNKKKLAEILVPALVAGIVLLIVIVVAVYCCFCKQGDNLICCKRGPRKQQLCHKKNKRDFFHFDCCDSFPNYFPKCRVNDAPVHIEPIVFHTAPRETSITCTWDKEFQSKFVVQLSYINTQHIQFQQPHKVLTAMEKQERSCTITHLQPRTTYNLVMKAINSRSQTVEESELIKVTTLGAALPPTDFDYDKKSLGSTSVTVVWKPAIYQREIQHFIIRFKRKKQKKNTWICTPQLYDEGKRIMQYIIGGLNPNTTYTFIICAENNIGKSNDSNPIHVKTKAITPLPPKWYKFLNIEDNNATVSWEPAFSFTNQIFRLAIYKMSTQTSNEDEQKEKVIFVRYTKPLMEHTFIGLEENTLYQFVISTLIGKKRSIALIGSLQTEGKIHARKLQQKEREKLTTTERHIKCNA